MVAVLGYFQYDHSLHKHRSSPLEVFFKEGALQICRKFTSEQSYRIVISIKMHCNFIKITLFRCSGCKIMKAKYELLHPPEKSKPHLCVQPPLKITLHLASPASSFEKTLSPPLSKNFSDT